MTSSNADHPSAGAVHSALRDRSRAAVGRFLAALTAGRRGDAVSTCASQAVWWLPVGEDRPVAIDTAADMLLAFIGPDRSPEEPLIIVSDDGEAAVVEQVVRTPRVEGQTTVTSVVQLRDGLIVEGRTYADVAAWPAEVKALATRETTEQ